ncbi:MAG TPA: methionyl-tRNA formyltransferase [Verrucomicrobiae bacterium]|nr:methionyl-tRNA formyltransferase [Verrucomicrobiae bacterium]
MRVLFFGTAELACASLEALANTPEFEVVAVITQPDKPRGRDLQVQPSAPKSAALKRNIPVLQPLKARDESFLDELRSLNPELIVVVAYGQILPQALLDLPRHGCLNVHTSLLPKYRGAAPIQWAILNGDPQTGVTIMRMDAGLDTGPIISQRATGILPEDTSQTLHDRLAKMGAELLLQTIPPYIHRQLRPVPQPEGGSYARKIEKSDGLIDWSEPAEVISRKIRAFNPWPSAFTFLQISGQERRVKIWAAAVQPSPPAMPGAILRIDREGLLIACGTRALLLQQVQPEGRKRMSIQDFLAGHSVTSVSAAARPAARSK